MLKDERNTLYFRDLQDHVLRVTESTDTLRDSVYSLVEMHMNTASIRMNEVMKVLTIITTIFTPIMFLSSIYGMNFDWIPETHVKGGYWWFWIIIAAISGVQIFFFKKKRWL
jgi:magnesium transporter